MPVGRPDPDGTGAVVPASRSYRGRTLGEATIWDCPACGVKNEGRTPEKGCAHCGAGDQSKGRAGSAASADLRGILEEAPGLEERAPGRPLVGGSYDAGRDAAPRPVYTVERPQAPTTVRVLRLIEYLIAPGQSADAVLRRSLVGRLDLEWGSITGTIVDTIDPTQEDRLALARKQPGVWLAHPEAQELTEMADRLPKPASPVVPQMPAKPTVPRPASVQEAAGARTPPPPAAPARRDQVPDVGPAYTTDDAILAEAVERLGGLKLVYTLALALQTVAQELEGNMEPEKFLTSEEAIRLASALMARVPEDWAGDPQEETT